MNLLLCLALLCCILGAGPRLHAHMQTPEQYMSRERCCAINGVFIWLVAICHMNGPMVPVYGWDAPVLYVLRHLGQCVVATFFFFSGYGLMYCLETRRNEYARFLLTRRFPRLLIYFGVAVWIFTLCEFLTGKSYTVDSLWPALLGWEYNGDDNWFIFITLLVYIVVALSYHICHRWGDGAVACATGLCLLVLMPWLQMLGDCWVNTYLCVPAGMLLRCTVRRVDACCRRLPLPAWVAGCILAPGGVFLHLLPWLSFARPAFAEWHVLCGVALQNVGAILFAGGVCLFSACVEWRRSPRFLVWSGGAALFALYIYQRVPLLLGSHWGWHVSEPWLFHLGCVVFMLLIARLFVRLTIRKNP